MSHALQSLIGGDKEIGQELAIKHSTDRVQRGSTRKRMIGNALLVFNNGHCTMECIVLNVSDSGAKIRPVDLMTLPEQFEIRIKSKLPYPCEVVRRSANYLGVRYVNAPMEAAPAS